MFCSKCGTYNEDTAKYCRGCGEVLNAGIQKNNKKSKTVYYIIGAIIILIALIAAIMLGFREKKAKEYDTYLTVAAKYVEELNYEQARDYYLKAIAIAPKELEPYVRLAQVYVIEGDIETAEKIIEKAKDQNATGDEYIREELKAIISEIAGNGTDTESEVKIKTGKPLEYDMKEEYIEFRTSNGKLYYTNTIKYPYFYGESAVEMYLNDLYAQMIHDFKDNDMNVDAEYRDALEYNPGEGFPYYDDVTVSVTYNDRGYLSLIQYSTMWSGGAHPYTSEKGYTYQVEDGMQMNYYDIIVGTEEERTRLARYYLEKEGLLIGDYVLNSFYESAYTLNETGVCFYVWMGDAVPRAEVIIPYTENDSCIISAKDAL